ncbi:MAG: SprT-like domain-containing protein [Cytophagales bacterium]|nr:SprT-like domain-containing protein [Cytophagales bacterium]
MKSKKPISEFFPPDFQAYCLSFFDSYTFDFKVYRSRKSKLGDYRYLPLSSKHIITVNGDLNPFAFTITFLHEAAHMVANIKYGRKIQPHGKQWKDEFREILLPLLRSDNLPDNLRLALLEYIANPRATSCSSEPLMKALRDHDDHDGKVYLSEIKVGETFQFQERLFRLDKPAIRTRVTCTDLTSKRKYLINKNALVQLVQKGLF